MTPATTKCAQANAKQTCVSGRSLARASMYKYPIKHEESQLEQTMGSIEI